MAAERNDARPPLFEVTPQSTRFLALVMALISGALVIAHTVGIDDNPNSASRLATIDSIVHRGTVAMDDSSFVRTIDKAWVDGHFYSTKPFLLSFVGAALYGAFQSVTGLTFESARGAAIWFCSLMIGGLPHFFLLYFFYRFLEHWVSTPDVRLCAYLCICLGYMGLGYATAVNNHSTAAAVLFIAFYHAFIVRRGISTARRDWMIAGFLAGLLPTIDHPSFVFSISLTIYLALFDFEKTCRYFLTAALIPLVAHFNINYLITGSLLPIEIRRETFVFPGSYWISPVGNDALMEPKSVYFFHIIFGHHGYLAMTPVFFLAAIAFYKSLSEKDQRYEEALCLGIPFLILFLAYGFLTSTYAGSCNGVRWFILFMPITMTFTAAWLDRARSRAQLLLFFALFWVSMFNALGTLASPWAPSPWSRNFFTTPDGRPR